MLCFLGEIGQLYMKTGKGNKKRVINIDAVKQQIEQGLADDIDINKLCAALSGLHMFTGWDSVSTFAGKGKAKCYSLLRKNLEIFETLESLGENWNMTDEVIEKMEMFCCSVYGGGRETNVNKLWYKIYCSKRRKLECKQLPPCKQSLVKDIRKANYQIRISPDGHDWPLLKEDGKQCLEIDWFYSKPAPDEVKIIVLFIKMVYYIKLTLGCRDILQSML